MNRRSDLAYQRALLKQALARLRIAWHYLDAAFKADEPADLAAAVRALRLARAIDPDIRTGLGRDRLLALARLRDAIFLLEARLPKRLRPYRRHPLARR
jgi:hypothetical protein